MKLSELELLQKQTERQATPHRVVSWEEVRKTLDWPNEIVDPVVSVTPVFVEEDNTGYDGNLFRCLVKLPSEDIETLQVDLVPELLIPYEEIPGAEQHLTRTSR